MHELNAIEHEEFEPNFFALTINVFHSVWQEQLFYHRVVNRFSPKLRCSAVVDKWFIHNIKHKGMRFLLMRLGSSTTSCCLYSKYKNRKSAIGPREDEGQVFSL